MTHNDSKKLDVVFYDACLMATLEEAVQIAPYVHYYVASENESWTSMPYDLYLRGINQTTTAATLARSLVKAYSLRTAGYPHTLSAMNQSQADALRTAVDQLALALIPVVSTPTLRTYIDTAHRRAQLFDSPPDHILDPASMGDEAVDLYDFAAALWQQQSSAPGWAGVRAAAAQVMNAITGQSSASGYVIEERHESGYYTGQLGQVRRWWSLDEAHGISIFFPWSKQSARWEEYRRAGLSLTHQTHWDEFLDRFLPDQPSSPSPIGKGGLDSPTDRPGPLPISTHLSLPLVRVR